METDSAFLLRILGDGRPHTLNEILQASFAERGCGLTVHSRVAELRGRGHIIENLRVPGGKRGAGSAYQLHPKDALAVAHDYTAEIQAAFDEANRTGAKTVVFPPLPPGETMYTISAPIKVKS